MCERFIVFNVSWYCKNRKKKKYSVTIFISYIVPHVLVSTWEFKRAHLILVNVYVSFSRFYIFFLIMWKFKDFLRIFSQSKFFRLSFQHCFLIARFSMNLYIFLFFFWCSLQTLLSIKRVFLYRFSCLEIIF